MSRGHELKHKAVSGFAAVVTAMNITVKNPQDAHWSFMELHQHWKNQVGHNTYRLMTSSVKLICGLLVLTLMQSAILKSTAGSHSLTLQQPPS